MEIIDLNKFTIENNNYPSKQELQYHISQGLTYRQMQEVFGLSKGSMSRAMKLYGLKTKNNYNGSKKQSEIIKETIRLRNENKSIYEIAEIQKVTREAIYARLKKYQPNYKPHRPNKYTEEEVRIMRKLRERDYSYQRIADMLGRNAMGIWQKLQNEPKNYQLEETPTNINNKSSQFCLECCEITNWKPEENVIEDEEVFMECATCGSTDYL